MAYVSRMRRYYQDEVVPAMQRQFEYDNVMRVPRVQKNCLEHGVR